MFDVNSNLTFYINIEWVIQYIKSLFFQVWLDCDYKKQSRFQSTSGAN